MENRGTTSRAPRGALVVLLVGLVLVACRFDGGGLGAAVDATPKEASAPDLSDVGVDLSPDLGPQCVDDDCTLGCNVAADRCARLMPSNVDPRPFYEDAKANVLLDAPQGPEIVIDGATGALPGYRAAGDPVDTGDVHYELVTMKGGLKAAVFAFDTLRVTAGTTVRVVGIYPVILYARERVEIRGALLASATIAAPGAGGFTGGAKDGQQGNAQCSGSGLGGGQQSELTGIEWEAGGGGGGYGAAGARGADVWCKPATVIDNKAAGGLGGSGFGVDELIPLRGGCGGGAGGGPDVSINPGHGGAGGHGGGALQISAGEHLEVAAGGFIDAGGGGGQGGTAGAGGGGGGSGGAIVLEAPTLSLRGFVSANGGGGGAGSDSSTLNLEGAAGEDGQRSEAQAKGGLADLGTIYVGTSGGLGGALAGAAVSGSDSDDRCNGGGGGGGVGRIRVNSNPGQLPGKSSPAPSTGFLLPPW